MPSIRPQDKCPLGFNVKCQLWEIGKCWYFQSFWWAFEDGLGTVLFIGLLLPISEQLAKACAFFLYVLPGARFRALSAGVYCTLWAARWKPTRNHIFITVGLFNLHKGWLSLHRGHPVNVSIRRSMLLSSVIPANDTRERKRVQTLAASGYRTWDLWHQKGTSNHWATMLSVHVRVQNYAKCEWKFQNASQKYLYKQILQSAKLLIKILNSNLPVFLLCAIIQSTHKSIYFVWK